MIGGMAATVEFFYDFGSPYTYLASTRIESVVSRHGAVLAWRPFLLGGVFKTLGATAPAMQSQNKARWLLLDLQRWADHLEVPFEMNPHFPVNTLKAMRMAVAAEEKGCQVQVAHRLFEGMWVEKLDLSQDEVLIALADEAGAPGAKLLERTGAGHVKDRLRNNTDEAVERGAFGAPAIFMGDEFFFGNDRLQFLEEALARAG